MRIQKTNTKIIAVLGALLLSANIYSQNPNFHIYLCFGQSNMEGQGEIQEQDKTVSDRFRVMQALDCTNLERTKGTWYTAVPPLCQCWSGLTPADYFGRTMIANLPDSITVGVINVAIGGCDIRIFDKNIYQDYDDTYTESWFTEKVKAYGGNPYQYLIDLAKQAQKDGVIKGILLHQGETNTGDKQWPLYVEKVYNNMMTDLLLDPELVPLLAGEVVSEDQGGICASMNAIIATLPNVVPTAYVISSSACTAKSDSVHFNSEGYREIGKRYAVKMLSLMGYKDIKTGLDISGENKSTPEGYLLEQNFPNPTVNSTNISFEIPTATNVSLKVFDMNGIEVEELGGRKYEKGKHTIKFNTANQTGGVYIYTMTTAVFTASRKMILVAG